MYIGLNYYSRQTLGEKGCMRTGRQRNYGIDFLRIISMIFIITIHTFFHGGILEEVLVGSSQYYVAYLVYTIVYSGVDIFAIISGFVGYTEQEEQRPPIKRFITLWFQVVFYATTILFVFVVSGEYDLTLHALVRVVTPLTSGYYWYFKAYFVVILFSPVLNCIVKENDKRWNTSFLVIGAFLLLLSHKFDGFFSSALLLYCYILGAIIQKYEVYKVLNKRKLMKGLVLMIIFTWSWKVILSNINENIGSLFLRYDSPTLISIATIFVLIFANVNFKPSKWLTLFSRASFSAYLINDNPMIRECYIKNEFAYLANETALYLLIFTIFFSISFFGVSCFIDMGRARIFTILRVKEVSEYIERKGLKIIYVIGNLGVKIVVGLLE